MDDDILPIAVMGATGSGKSSFINLASGSDMIVGDGLTSCTDNVQVSNVFEVHGRQFILIDTPGFDDTLLSDTDILRLIAVYLSTTYEKGQKLRGIIWLHRITDNRVGGVARRNFSMFRKLCGDDTLGSIAIVTNMWEDVALEKAVTREQQLAGDDIYFKPVIDAGAKMLRNQNNTPESAHQILEYFLDKESQALLIQRELVDEHKLITETAAGRELDSKLAEAEENCNDQLEKLGNDLAEALDTKDDKTIVELKEERTQLENRVKQLQNDRERLLSDYENDKRQMADAMKDLQERLQAEMDELKRQHAKEVREVQQRHRKRKILLAIFGAVAEKCASLIRVNHR